MSYKIRLFFAVTTVVFSISCSNEEKNKYQSGKLDLSRVVAIGNSLTAGMVSGGWTYEMVQNAYTGLIIKEAFGASAVGDGKGEEVFVVPRITDPGAILPLQVAQYNDVGAYSNGQRVYRYTTTGGGIDINRMVPDNFSYSKPFNNLAVPGATARDNAVELTGLTASLASPPFGNPLFQIVTRERASSADQAVELKPTLAIFWAGNNEILSSALSGGVRAPFPLEDSGTTKGYRYWHTTVMQKLLGTGARVVTATIPDVTVIPAVSMVGITTPANAKAYIADLNRDGIYADTLVFWGTDNGVTRQLRGTEKVLMGWMGREPELNAGRLFGLSESDPLPDNLWLSEEELTIIANTTAAYNQYIKSWESDPKVAVLDVHTLFNEIAAKNGQTHTINGQNFNVDLSLPYGDFFSLDGVHPSSFGQRVLANAFVQLLNTRFKAELPAISLVRPASKSIQAGKGIPSGKPASAPFYQWIQLLGLTDLE